MLIYFLRPHFGELGGHFGAYDPRAFKKYQEQLKRKYSYRKHEPKKPIVVLPDEMPSQIPVEPPRQITFEAVNAVAELLAGQAEAAVDAPHAIAALERLLEQYQASQVEAAQQAAIEQALAEQWAMDEMVRYAEILRLQKKLRNEEEAMVLIMLNSH